MTMTQWNAEDYHKNSSQQHKWASELIEKLNLHGDEHVLDLGCGDGKISAELASRLPRGKVVGVDVSAEMIDFASANFTPTKHPNLRFARVDASALDFDNQFDIVFSNAVLHWIADHRPVLHGIAKALKPSGRILVQMGGRGCAVDVLAAVSELSGEPTWREYFTNFSFRYSFYSPDEYRPWLAEAGLVAQRVELIPKDMTHTGAEGFGGWIRTTWMPWIQSVPEVRREKFIQSFVNRYVAAHPVDDRGRVHVKMVRLEVEATKGR